MTDGIIQKVFKNYDFVVCSNEHYKSIMKRLQQELIEEIKQKIDAHFNCVDIHCSLKEHLIGDNQE